MREARSAINNLKCERKAKKVSKIDVIRSCSTRSHISVYFFFCCIDVGIFSHAHTDSLIKNGLQSKIYFEKVHDSDLNAEQ